MLTEKKYIYKLIFLIYLTDLHNKNSYINELT